MQIINHDISSIAVDPAAIAAWPIDNVLDDFALNYYKAEDNIQSAEIQINMPDFTPWCNAVYLGYTSANVATLSVCNSAEVEQQSLTMYLIPFNFFTFLQQKQVLQTREAFQEFTNLEEETILKLTLVTTEITDLVITSAGTGYAAGTLTGTGGNGTGFRGTYTVNSSGAIDSVTIIDPGLGYTSFSGSPMTVVVSDTSGSGAVITAQSTVNAGIIRAGYAKEFKNPKFGFTETKLNYGSQIEYVDGSIQSINGRIRRIFKANVEINITEESNLKEMIDKGTREPLAFNMFNGERRGVIMGWITSDPVYSRNSLNRINCSFDVREI